MYKLEMTKTNTKTTEKTVAKTADKSVSGKTVAAKVATPVVEPAVVQVVAPVEESNDLPVDFTQVDEIANMPEEPDQISIQFDGIVQTLSTFRQSITALQTQIRGLEKCVRKEIKGLRKEATKNRNKGNRKPSGFAKPSLVTDELCVFMNKDKGTEIARTEVTQFLIKYINENSLQFEANKKIILPDATLKKLLNVKDGEEVTYFNLQGLMNKHFIKKDAAAVASSTA